MTRVGIVFSVWFLTACLVGGTSEAAPAATRPDVSATAPDSAGLCATVIDEALAGRFDEAVEKAASAAGSSGQNSTAARLAELLDEYVARSRKWEAHRQQEYERTVRRVQRAMLAQEFTDGADKGQLEKIGKAREKMSDLSVLSHEADKRELLEQADGEKVDELKKESLDALSKAGEHIDEVEKLFRGGDSKYHRRFRDTIDTVRQRMKKYRDLWTDVTAENLQRKLAEGEFAKVADDFRQSLADVEAMVTKEPWQVALVHARVASEVAGETRRPGEEQWYKTLVEDVISRGTRAMADARWRDALEAYVGLKELEPDNLEYQRRLKQIRQHVRVLSLYGGKEDEEADDDSAESDMDWQRRVSGVDAKMVKDAISKIDSYYVTSVDYSKLIHSALLSIEVLAKTPQVANTFEGLKDNEAKREFLQEIDDLNKHFEKQDRLDHMDLQLALVVLLGASDKTVNIPTEVLAVEFAEGMMEELDKFSSMIWPDDVSDFQKQISGKFYGVGIQITKDPGQPLEVVTPLLDTPAYNAGIKSGDKIIEVEGRRTEDFSLDRLVRMITGPKGTKVNLKIKRAGMLEPFEVSLARDEIKIQTVRGWRRKSDGTWSYTIDSVKFAPTGENEKIGYIRLTQFTKQTSDDMEKVLEDLREDGVDSVVLDLRFNPGGMLRTAIEIADEFLSDGVVVSTRGRQVKSAKYDAGSRGEFHKGNLVVLIDQYSASASEIVSGAMKDLNRGLIIGQRTYGKGSVQNILSIRAKRAYLKLTTAYYYLPSGRLIHRRNGAEKWGVDPDIRVDMTPGQLQRWLEIRRETDLLKKVDEQRLDRQLSRQFKADIQLNTAVLMLRLMRLQRELNEHPEKIETEGKIAA